MTRRATALFVAAGLLGPGSAQAGSGTTFAVSVRVARSTSAAVPGLLAPGSSELRAAARRKGWTVRFTPRASGERPAFFVGAPGGRARRCAERGCEAEVGASAGAAGEVLVVTLLPDGAPAAIAEQ
jgi:hypothetical protein